MMESEMSVTARPIIGKPIPALLTPFSFGLDIHAFALKLLQDQWLFPPFDVHLDTELGLGSDTTAATSYTYNSTRRRFVTCE